MRPTRPIESVSEQAGAGRDLRRSNRPPQGVDKLPPHSDEAEQAVLGCLLMPVFAPEEIQQQQAALRLCQDKFQQDEVFYDLRHQSIWRVIQYLVSEGKPVDIITVQAELKNRALLDQIGGIAYLNTLQDAVPSVASVSTYLDLVWEKYVLRRLVQRNTRQVDVVYEFGGVDESYIARIEQEHKEWTSLLDRGAVTPKHLKPAGEFIDQYYRRWFDRKDDVYGYSLPFEFPMRFRPKCSTLMTGDNGSGKTTMLLYIAAHVATQLDVEKGERLVLASMEMPPEATLYTMARQLLTVGPLVHTAENQALVASALAWLNTRVLIYDFLGITDRHELMNSFEYAVEHQNAKFFILDNLMKVGIADDDYAGQGFFVQRFHDFQMRRDTHGILVVHENKGDGSAKNKVRGSKQITDAPNNVIGMKRNEEKKLKLDEINADIEVNPDQRSQLEGKRKALQLEADAWFSLYKQRWEDTQQNARARLYYAQGMRFVKSYGEPVRPIIHVPKHKN